MLDLNEAYDGIWMYACIVIMYRTIYTGISKEISFEKEKRRKIRKMHYLQFDLLYVFYMPEQLLEGGKNCEAYICEFLWTF